MEIYIHVLKHRKILDLQKWRFDSINKLIHNGIFEIFSAAFGDLWYKSRLLCKDNSKANSICEGL